MIRFAVFNDAGPAADFPLHHAYLVGKEDLTVPGTISFENGVLYCKRHSTDAAALALQVDAGSAGRLTLQTCLLPDRDEPYVLNVELARHRIMLLLNKLEEWSLSDLPNDHPVMAGFERARQLFTQALIAPRRGADVPALEQSRLARQSLVLGIEAGEQLTALQAERELALRFDPRPPGPAPEASPVPAEPPPLALGCTLHPDQFAEPLQRIVVKNFDFISCPMRWAEIEREEGRHNFAPTDRWIEWAVRTAKLPVAGGPVLDFSPRSLPKWLYIWEHDYKTLRELAYEHLKTTVTRYRRAVSRWTVASGLNVNSDFSLRIEEMIDLTRLAVLSVRKLQPGATILVEINQPFGEHVTHIDRSVAPILYAGLVKESGIAIDGFAIRLQIGDAECGRSSRDLMQLSAVLDTFAEFDRPIHVTAVGAPSQPISGPAPQPLSRDQQPKFSDLAGEPGYWRQPWSPAQQAEWMTQALSLALAKPFVHSVCWQALFDTEQTPEMRTGGLIGADGRAKPALKRIGDIAAALKAKTAPTRLPPADAEPEEPARPAHTGQRSGS